MYDMLEKNIEISMNVECFTKHAENYKIIRKWSRGKVYLDLSHH